MAISEETLAQRLADLRQLLPNLVSKMAIMGPDNLAKLAADPSSVALKLVQLTGIFPEADISRMVAHRMGLILQDNLADVAAAAGDTSGSGCGLRRCKHPNNDISLLLHADELRTILRNVNVDK